MSSPTVDNKSLLDTILNTVPDPMISVDEKGIIHGLNKAASQLVNLKESELIGKSSHTFFHPSSSTPDDCQICQASFNSDQTFNLELNVPQLERWFKVSLSTISIDHNSQRRIEVMRDITDMKKLEDQYHQLMVLKDSIVHNLPMMLFVKEANDLRFVEWNKTAEDMTGMLKHEMIGKSDSEFWPEDEAKYFRNKDREVLKGKLIEDIPNETLSTKIGTYTLHTKKIPIYNSNGEPRFLLGISEDISNKLKTEEALRQSQKMDAMGNLSGGIAHDYNNMLGIILGYSNILIESLSDDKEALEYAKEIRHAGERGAKLTKKLLAFSRKKTTDMTTVDISQLISNEQHMLEKTLTVRIQLLMDLQKDLWPVWLDSNDFENALINLAVNAMHAMDGEGQLTIKTNNYCIPDDVTIPGLQAGDYVVLTISDTGCGMKSEISTRMFEPFFSTKGEKGTGLGLSQVYGFVKRSAGNILVDSKLNKGTTLKMYFPRFYLGNDNQYVASDITTEKNEGKETILVVDDEPALTKLLKIILDKAGYRVICADSADAGMETLKNEHTNVVITDVLMPGKDGYQFSANIKENYPDIKIQLVSGYSDNNNWEMVDKELSDNIIGKPIDANILLTKVRELID